MVVLKEFIWTDLYFGRVWWSWKNWFWTVSCLGGCGGLERTDFEQFLLWEGVVVLKELILNSFYFERTVFEQNLGGSGWSWKNWFWTVSTLGGCGGPESTDFEQTLGGYDNLERTDFEQFLLWEGMVVLKELILNSFYVWEDMVVLKEFILNRFYFKRVWLSWKNWFLNSFYLGRVWLSWKDWFWTVSCLGGCGSLERIHFEQIPTS